MTPATAQILRDAADYIVEHGWCQGRYQDENGKVCAAGAVMMAAPTTPDYADALVVLKHFLFGMSALGSISAWNDRDGQTAEGVVAGLRAAGGAA